MRAEDYDQELLERFRQKLKEPPPPPFEVARRFLSFYFCDADGWNEAVEHIADFAKQRPNVISDDLKGIELFLANPPQEEGVLANLVAWEANWVLEDPSDEGAKKWLREVAETVREILGDDAPPRPQK